MGSADDGFILGSRLPSPGEHGLFRLGGESVVDDSGQVAETRRQSGFWIPRIDEGSSLTFAHKGAGLFESVLVGGAVVAIYTEGLYRSGDLDMVPDDFVRNRLPEALAKIGFEPTQSLYFKHPLCPHLFLEFPRGPVETGEQYPVIPAECSSSLHCSSHLAFIASARVRASWPMKFAWPIFRRPRAWRLP